MFAGGSLARKRLHDFERCTAFVGVTSWYGLGTYQWHQIYTTSTKLLATVMYLTI
jgi:hypothetical protein